MHQKVRTKSRPVLARLGGPRRQVPVPSSRSFDARWPTSESKESTCSGAAVPRAFPSSMLISPAPGTLFAVTRCTLTAGSTTRRSSARLFLGGCAEGRRRQPSPFRLLFPRLAVREVGFHWYVGSYDIIGVIFWQ